MSVRRAGWFVALLVLACAASACGGKDKSASGRGGGAAAPGAALELPPIVPAGAVLIIGFDASPEWLASAAAMGGMPAEAAHALRDDLALYLKKTTGLELGKVHRGTIFATADDQGAIIVRDVGGEWKAPLPDDELAVARHEDYLILGAKPAVDLALAVAQGKAPGLKADAPLAALFAKESAGAAIAVAVDAAALPIPEVQAGAARFGVTHAFVSVGSRRIHLVARGDGKKLQELVSLVESQLAAASTMLEAQKTRMIDSASTETGVDPEALGVIFGAHTLKHFAATFKPKVEGDSLRVDFALDSPDAVMIVAGVGMLSAIAIPAFMKYMRKSKTTEAVVGVKKIYDGARAYYLENNKMPAPAPLTPKAGACCEGPEGKCTPDATLWTGPWEPLRFAVEDPSYYSYQLDSDGTSFTARAIGDLDCDGTFSTFEMTGLVMPDGTLRGSGGVYKNNELE